MTQQRSTITVGIHEAIAQMAPELESPQLPDSIKAAIERLVTEAQTASAVLERLISTNMNLAMSWDTSGVITYITSAASTILGYDPAEMIGRKYEEFLHPDDKARTDQAMEQLMREGSITGFQNRHISKTGQVVWLEWAAVLVPGKNAVYGVAQDQSRRVEFERRLRESELLYKALFEHSPDAVFSLDVRGRFVSLNPACQKVTGYTERELVRKPLHSLIAKDELRKAWSMFKQSLEGTSQHFDASIIHKEGSHVVLNVTTVPIILDDKVIGIYCVATDITERKLAEEQLAHLAFHDPLTGLTNRALFMRRMERALSRTARDQPSLAILYLDLDDFKLVNDSLGHRAGDELLIETARRLRACVRTRDTVARLGGDEFTILLENTEDTDDAIRVAERILAALHEPFVIDGHKLVVTPSVGVVMGNQGSDSKELLRYADIAMYQAKHKGKARYEAFTPVMHSQVMQRMQLEGDIRRAVERQEFRLYYQPLVELGSGQISGVEALIRWEDPQDGIVSPAEFIPLAEETGLILPIGKWVLWTACRQCQEWQAARPGLVVSVNLSAKQFQEPDLANEVARVLRETGLNPAYLQLEITETVLMQDAELTQGTLRDLKELGVSLAMDDFGTGYSSLNYLKRFPIDNLKIDRSFVSGLGQNPEDTVLVRTVVMLAKALNLTVTGEGVETPDQAAGLRTMGCERGQGYYFAKPLATEGITSLLSEGMKW